MFHLVILFMKADNWVLAAERCNYFSPATGLCHCWKPGIREVGGAGGSCPVHALWALQTIPKQQTEWEVPNNTYYRINGILMFAYATPVAQPVRLTEQVGWKGKKPPAKCHS